MFRTCTDKLRAVALGAALLITFHQAPQSGWAQPAKLAQEVPSLKQIFSRNGPFMQPTPRQVAYAPDGKTAAYLHGRNLWLFDSATGKTRVAVDAKTMAFEHVPAGHAPGPFGLVSAFAWSGRGDELLFVADDCVYRYEVKTGKIDRAVDVSLPFWQYGMDDSLSYLPDGSGFLLVRGLGDHKEVFRGSFRERTIEAWQPKLPREARLLDLQISPDGRQLALTVYEGSLPSDTKTEVAVASFRGRFTSGIRVRRQLPGDDLLAGQVRVYLAPITALTENTPVQRAMFAYQYSGPADNVSPVDWSLDSRRFAFAVTEQKTDYVRIVTVNAAADAWARYDRVNLLLNPLEQLALGLVKERLRTREVQRFKYVGGPLGQYLIEPRFLSDNRTLAFVKAESGFWQVHTLDVDTGATRQVTHGDFEVYPVAMSSDRKEYYVAAAAEQPSCRDLYRVNFADGKLQRLTPARGTYGDMVFQATVSNVAIRGDGRQILTVFAAFGTLKELVAVDVAAAVQTTLTRSHSDFARQVPAARPEFFSYRNRHGETIHGYLFKPADWKPTDRRPAMIYVYGGPTVKLVQDGEALDYHLFAWYMAQKHGFVMAVIDTHGATGYGARFEQANFNHPGKAAVEDLQDGARYLADKQGVDPRRIALHGWSFGGFLTQLTMYTTDTFAVGIAGAGPTEWANYNATYASTVIGEPGPHGTNMEKFSLLPLARNLKGRLLLVHGLEDANVLVQDTIHVYRELLRAGKATQVSLFLDPTGGHCLGGDVTLADRYEVFEQYLVRRLTNEAAR